MGNMLSSSPPSFRRGDVDGTVRALCNYTSSLQEDLDYMLLQLRKRMDAAEESTTALTSKLSEITSSLSKASSKLERLEDDYNKLATLVTALEGKSN